MTSEVHLVGGDDLLLFHHAFDGDQLVAQGRGLFKLHAVGGLLHFSLEPCHHRFGGAAQEFAQVVDHRPVFRLGGGANAGGHAQVDVVVEAGARVMAGDDAVTGEIGEDLAQNVERLIDGPHAGVRAEISRAVFGVHPACHGHGRKRIRVVHFDVGVALVVFEPDVVLGPVFLDQVHLEDERLELGADDDRVEVGDVLHQLARFRRIHGLVEIRPHAVAQVDGLAHVNDLARAIFIEVTAGFGGEGVELLLQSRYRFHTSKL